MIGKARARRRPWVIGVACLLATAGCSTEEPGRTPAPQMAPAEAAADDLIEELSEHLAGVDEFTFQASRHLDAGLLEGRNIPEDAKVMVAVKRPNKIHAVSRSGLGVRHFYFDGQKVTLYDETRKLYATANISGTIDEMAARLDERFGFTPPLIEFIVSDFSGNVQDQIKSRTLAGTATVDGIPCSRIQFSGAVADGELFVDADQELPCGLTAAFRDLEGSPRVKITFTNWNLGIDLDDPMFTFTPPAGARQIRMLTVEEWDQGK